MSSIVLIDQNFSMKMEGRVITSEDAIKLVEGRQKGFHAFETETVPMKNQTQGKGIIILTTKPMPQRLSMEQPQVKADTT